MPTRPLILGLGDTLIGAFLLTGNPSRTSSPAYAGIKQLAPIYTWGLVLLLTGIALLTCLLLHNNAPPHRIRLLEAPVSLLGASWAAFWATALIRTAHQDTRVGYTGGALWLLFVTVPHLLLALGSEG